MTMKLLNSDQIKKKIATIKDIIHANISHGCLHNKHILFLLSLILFITIIIARRSDVIFCPQFHVEDGSIWYSEAYHANNPFLPFLIPKSGHFQTISRIGGLLSNLIPLQHAPLFMNIIAILIQVAPALFFLSKRFEIIVKQQLGRFLIGIIYLLLPATQETHITLTTSMWRLALLAFLIIIATPSQKIIKKTIYSITLFISGVSGPFVLYLFPIFLIHARFLKIKLRIYCFIPLLLTFFIQLYCYIATSIGIYPDGRSSALHGEKSINFFKILSGKIFLSGIFGLNAYRKILYAIIWDDGYLPILISIIGVALMLYTFIKAKVELRLFLLLSLFIFVSAMLTPLSDSKYPHWLVMLSPLPGNRYFFFPILALNLSIIFIAFNSPTRTDCNYNLSPSIKEACRPLSYRQNICYFMQKTIRFLAILLIGCFFLFGVRNDFFFGRFKNYHFKEQVLEFNKIRRGQTFTFTIYPGWQMTLKKKD